MCGIYGYIGKPTNSEKILDCFIDLGIETEERGTHATGYYGVNDQVRMHKAPLRATEFYLECRDFYDLYENVPSVLIGHNRWASCGDPKINKNNHPFMNERFGFIHNGCVKGWTNFKSLGITIDTECDSEWIFNYFLKTLELHHGNIISAIKKTLNIFDDSTLACAMVDSKTKKLYLFRNIGNPICYIVNKEQNVILFASTPHILEDALKLHNLPIENIVDLEKGDIVCIDEDLNIEKETCAHLRGARTSYLSTIRSSWGRNLSRKKITGTGYKCLKCGKKFISQECVENHLEDVHHIMDKLDEDEDITDYWEDITQSVFPKLVNRKADFKAVKSGGYRVIKKAQVETEKKTNDKPLRTYSSFEEMQKDTEQIVKLLEEMPI